MCFTFLEQAEESVSCSIRHFGGPTPPEGPYGFSNLNASGILPGWSCTITGCFSIDDGTVDGLFVHTPAKNFILPQCASGKCHCDSSIYSYL